MTVTLRVSSLAAVRALPGIQAATREHVTLSPTARPTHWYIIRDDEANGTVGIIAFISPRAGVARIKGLWVYPDERGNGYGRQATMLLERDLVDLGYGVIERFAMHPGWPMSRGWEQTGHPARSGAVLLRKSVRTYDDLQHEVA